MDLLYFHLETGNALKMHTCSFYFRKTVRPEEIDYKSPKVKSIFKNGQKKCPIFKSALVLWKRGATSAVPYWNALNTKFLTQIL